MVLNRDKIIVFWFKITLAKAELILIRHYLKSPIINCSWLQPTELEKATFIGALAPNLSFVFGLKPRFIWGFGQQLAEANCNL
jgi:hypothetical protein